MRKKYHYLLLLYIHMSCKVNEVEGTYGNRIFQIRAINYENSQSYIFEVYGMLRNILEKMCNINIRYQNDRHKPCLDL